MKEVELKRAKSDQLIPLSQYGLSNVSDWNGNTIKASKYFYFIILTVA